MIYIITHKEFEPVVNEDFYETLLVGAYEKESNIYKLLDSTGNNISSKNANFCELTGIYWIWKNISDDVVGICHYRRYFANSVIQRKKSILTQEQISDCLKDSDIILPCKRWFQGKNAKQFYSKYHNINDWNKMIEVLRRLYPEYDDDISWFEVQKSGYCYNMFIMKKKLFDEYCEWLFSILFEVERNTDTTSYTAYNKRIYGFLSERMINIWIHHNKLRVCEKNIYNPNLYSMLVAQTKSFIIRKIKGEEK